MMTLPDDLPISQSLAVFFGVSGFEWLTEGRAEFFEALAIAIASGIAIFIVRRWLHKRRRSEH